MKQNEDPVWKDDIHHLIHSLLILALAAKAMRIDRKTFADAALKAYDRAKWWSREKTR